jgi:hypothetical protein
LANGVPVSTAGKNACGNTSKQIVLQKQRSIETHQLSTAKKGVDQKTDYYTGASPVLKNQTANALHRLFLSVLICNNLRHQRFYQHQ